MRGIFLAVLGGVLAVAVVTSHATLIPGYAIVGARVVTVSGKAIERGTVVVRGGIIASVDNDASAPGDVQQIDGTGLTVYPGLIDLHASAGLDEQMPPAPQNPESREVSERFRRQLLLRAHVQAADLLRADSSDLGKLAAAGVTNAVLVPRGDGIAGHSALVDVAAPETDPQVGRLAFDARGPMVLRTPVALHVGFPGRGFLGAYPASLMGGIAFIRQAFLDAQHYRLAAQQVDAAGSHDAALAAMSGAVGGTVPVAFQASTPREIRRALTLAREFSLTPVIAGGHGAGEVAQELKAARARVVLSLNYPKKSKALAPDADEPYDTLKARADARTAAAALAGAGVPFGFGSAGLKDPKEFVANVRVAVERGLAPEAALKALTLDAAMLAGAASRLGSVEKGKRANLVVTDGDLFTGNTKVRYVFVGGRRVPLS